MAETNNLPSGGNGEAASVMDALADILDDPATDTVEDNKANTAAAAKAKGEPDDGEEPETPDDPEAEPEAEDPEGEAAEEGQGQLRDAQGRFLSDNDKVRLADGTTTTVAELKNGYLRQGDYTRKTQATAEESKAIKAERERVGQLAQQLDQQLAVATQWLEMTKPARPAVSYAEDPMAHGEYQDAMQRWEEARKWIGGHLQARQAALANAQREQIERYEKNEAEALRNAIPALRDPAKFNAFMQEAAKIAPDYGISADELKGVKDHRQWLVLRDALAYRRLKAKAPEVKQTIESKPALITGKKRPNQLQSQQRVRRDRTERLSREGTAAAAEAVLATMDL